ncbi:MAG: hypothetical protein ASARMPREDX12_009171 [Alectoria sarmentosa]|nr:MAG: hypothetical protein ASARMPRED_003933 [Alectoria sarmentosa]CAD6579448.1 MAG: hypothetical protein ASARMPREDX12_009171 [Alectoria sarmentosa]
MASSSGPGHPSGPDPGSVLCDKCRESVLEPSQKTKNISYGDRISQVLKEWHLSPPMWPVGYIIESPYSPFRVEQELPKRDWRDAFEDLLALESGGEMISHESRKQEKTMATKLSWERAYQCIEKLNKLNARDAPTFTLAQKTLNAAKSPGHQTDLAIISRLDKILHEAIEMVQRRVALAEAFKAREAARREWSASRHKDRGQWMASLITSGALNGWRSRLQDSQDGDLIDLWNESVAPEDRGSISFTELELRELIEDSKPLKIGSPGPPLYQVSPRPPAVPNDDDQFLDENSPSQPPPDERAIMSTVPERPCFWGQITAAERITLPTGKMATKVVMKNYLTNGDVEEKVMVQEPGKVLQEVEKARALIHDRKFGFDKPI